MAKGPWGGPRGVEVSRELGRAADPPTARGTFVNGVLSEGVDEKF